MCSIKKNVEGRDLVPSNLRQSQDERKVLAGAEINQGLAVQDKLKVGTVRKLKPFLKWAGGKKQLLPEIAKFYPFEDGKFTKYAEPFVGGGAVLFDVLSRFDLEAVFISDLNADLIDAYTAVKLQVEELIGQLELMQTEYLALNIGPERNEYYLQKRSRFNELKSSSALSDSEVLEKSVLLLFLNHTCFNGLYRVNQSGLFNVPPGRYKNPVIVNPDNLRAVSAKMQNIEIVCADYHHSQHFVDEHTFVYFDPPYRPLSSTASFNDYTACAFDDAAQIELSRYFRDLADKGARVLLSNSDPKNINPQDDFFEKIYQGFDIKRVKAMRSINSKASSRGAIYELLIGNM